MLRPSVQPSSLSPCRSKAARACPSGSSSRVGINMPIRRSRSGCCARAASGHTAAEPAIPLMKSRRRIAAPKAQGPVRTMLWNDAITAGICDLWNGAEPSFCVAVIIRTECPLWVRSGHSATSAQCPLYPRKQTLPGDSCTWSERWRCAITADAPRTTLERSIRQFDRDDGDRGAGFEICLIPYVVNDDGRIGRHKNFLFAVFVFQCQRSTVDGGADLLDIRICHHALRPKIPRVVSFSGSAHCLGKDVHFQGT